MIALLVLLVASHPTERMRCFSALSSKWGGRMFLLRVGLPAVLIVFWLVYVFGTIEQIFVSKDIMPTWQSIAAAKRVELMSKIPAEWRIPDETVVDAKAERDITSGFIRALLDNATTEITERDPVDVLELLRSGEFTAVEVVTAYCKRAAVAHQLNLNLLEIFFDSAIENAVELDRYYQRHGRTVGPLHGLPFTLKDQWHIKNVDTSMAYVGWIGTQAGRQRSGEAGDESELIKQLRSLGAVPIAKTTLMQSLWCGETNNNLLGYSWNPNIQTLSSGGSSGGEGALQALRGSAFGFGTDIGGSVSMPAAFNRIYSLKPSHGRISLKDTANSSPGQALIPTVAGIMARNLRTVTLVFECLLSTEPWLSDPDVLPIPFRKSDLRHRQLAIGILHTDGIVSPHPPVTRALRMVEDAMKLEGHQIIKWLPPSHAESSYLHSAVMEADGGLDVLERTALSGEPLMPEIAEDFASVKPPMPVTDFYNVSLQVESFRAAYASYWESTKHETVTGRPVDAFIMPVAPHAAPRPGKIFYYTYSSIINTLDYGSIVIPVTTANPRIDVVDADYQPSNDDDQKTWEAYEPDLYAGAPVAVQIVGGRLNEENLLAIADAVVEALRVAQQRSSTA